MARGGGAVSLRTSLFRSFVFLILLSTLIVLVLTWIRALDTERRLSDRLIRRGTEETRRELDRFLEPAAVGTRMGLAWGLAGNLGLTGVVTGDADVTTERQVAEARRLNGLLLPYLLAYPALSSVQIANAAGEGFLVLQLSDGRIVNRVVNRSAWGKRTLWLDVDREGIPQSWEWKEVDYEPRRRAWFLRAAEEPAGSVSWTDAYKFATTKDLGITASGRWSWEGVDHVLAYDVLLNDLTAFTQAEANQVSPNALALIATDDWKALGLPRSPALDTEEAVRERYLAPLTELGVAAVGDAVRRLGTERDTSEKVLEIESGGEDWWFGVRAYPLDRDRRLRIAVLVPNADLLEEVTQQRVFLLIATGLALAAALVYSLVLSRAYSRPLEALAAQSRRIRDLDFTADQQIDARLHEFEQLAQAQQQSLAALQSFARYVPVDVVRQLVSEGEVARIGGRTETLTILFTDIAGFTSISERMTPQALADHMARYFEPMIRTLQAHGATVDKLVGDAIVAFWGAPRRVEDHAVRGVRAVLACCGLLDELGARWAAEALPILPTRFGLSTGPAVVGNIGAASRLAYTALGDHMNLASRLEGLNKVYGTQILIDAGTRDAAGEAFEYRRVDRLVVVGRSEPTFVHEPLAEKGKLDSEALAAARSYERAWDAYAERDFERAEEILMECLMMQPDDGPGVWLLGRVRGLVQDPPPPGWEPTTFHTSK